MTQLVAKHEWKTEEGFDDDYVFWWLEDYDGNQNVCIQLGTQNKLDEITIPVADLIKELKRMRMIR